MEANSPILIVEDSDEDFEVVCWALQHAEVSRSVLRATRAEEALLRLNLAPSSPGHRSPLPCLVLLDLNLPGTNGRELLATIKQSDEAGLVPVVVLSTSNNPRDIQACYRLGASGYICKPLQLAVFADKIRHLSQYWFDTVTLPT